MPKKTKTGERFNFVYMCVKEEMKRHCGIFLNFTEYIEKMYGWTDSLRYIAEEDDGERSRILLEEYVRLCKDRGLVNLDVRKTRATGKLQAIIQGKNRYSIYTLKNDGQNIRQAAEYLKETFADAAEKNFTGAVKDSFERMKGSGDYQSEAGKLEQRCLKRGMTPYEGMAALLIYAQTGILPDEESSDTYLGRPNIYMAPKRKIEQISSIRTRCAGAEKVVQIVYANTSFLAGLKVTGEADSLWTASMGQIYATAKEIHMVLTDPESDAARDAALYKMRPSSLRISPEKIIAKNLKEIMFILPKYSDKKNIRVYLTDIALPCSYFQCEFKDHRRDNIKIDLYLPSFAGYEEAEETEKPGEAKEFRITDEKQSDGSQRQSFVIFRKDNPELYEIFSNNMKEIVNHSNKIYGE